ncbi:MAG: hypothetical protein Marn2KO_20120 [Marinobacter nauticus]
MPRTRDNFSKKVIRTLREQVSYRCSNPECRVITAAPGDTEDGVNRVGQAAHISAASPSGPRYDKNMSAKERASENNGIWLCNICAKKIDNSPSEYPVETLKNWKTTALRKAKSELGKPIPDEDYVVNVLSTAISGASYSSLPPQTAISNIHMAAAQGLSKKYPGFSFQTSYDSRGTKIHITPEYQEDLEFSFIAQNPEEATEQYFRLLRTGKPASFKIKSLKFGELDSLFQALNEEDATISIASQIKKDSIMKLGVIDDSSKPYFFDDIKGQCHLGTDGFFFEGSACSDIIIASTVIEKSGTTKESLNIRFDYSKWNDMPFRSLPYIRKLKSFSDKLMSSSKVTIDLEIEGLKVFEGQSNPNDFQRENLEIIELAWCAREVCVELDKEILFKLNDLSISDQNNIYKLYELLNFKRRKDLESEKSLEITFIADVYNLEEFNEMVRRPNTEVLINDHQQKYLEILGQKIEIPEITQIFKSVSAEIIEEITKDRTYRVHLKPLKGFEFWEGFNIKKNKKLIRKVNENN